MSFISETGFWDRNSFEGHFFDESLCTGIINYLTKKSAKSLFDFGCGNGYYTRSLIGSGFDCRGYDGNPHTESLTNNLCEVLDLTEDFSFTPRDYVLCLEVGEHIPSTYEQRLIDNIDKHNTKGIILSWAIEGQPGEGHVNCRNNDYIENIFKSKGYAQNIDDQNMLRESSSLWWFKNTIMVFERKES